MEKYVAVGRAGPRADARADAAGRADLDRRGLSRPLRDGAPAPGEPGRRRSPASPGASRTRSASRVSVGLSYNKFLAKIASDLDKPRGFAVIGRAEAVAFLADKPVGIIPGVGQAARRKLAQAGLRPIGDLRDGRPRRDPARRSARTGRACCASPAASTRAR